MKRNNLQIPQFRIFNISQSFYREKTANKPANKPTLGLLIHISLSSTTRYKSILQKLAKRKEPGHAQPQILR